MVLGALLFLAVAVSGCVAQLSPAPGSEVVPGPRGAGAVARAAGVAVTARADAWTGRPESLAMAVTPLLVTMEHNGAVPIRLRYGDFTLILPDGTRLAGHGPYSVSGEVTEALPAGAYYPWMSPGLGVGVASGFVWRSGLPVGHPFFNGYAYYPMYPMSVRVPLPTADMVAMALPERVVWPGERVAGFVYFDRVKRNTQRADFTLSLVDARTGDQVGTVTIPFVVE